MPAVVIAKPDDEIADLIDRVRASADLYNFRRLLELMGQLLDFTRERSGKHERLTFL